MNAEAFIFIRLWDYVKVDVLDFLSYIDATNKPDGPLCRCFAEYYTP